MSFEAIVSALREARPDAIQETVEDRGDPFVVVAAGELVAALSFLKDDPRTELDQLSLISGVDYPGDGVMEVVYHLDSIRHATPFTIKIKADRDDCRLPSVVALFATADWHEREVYDLSGVIFEGHPNLTRILCADDWEGHPLRKDYPWPEEYHGIPCGPFAGDGVNIPAEWEIEGFTTVKEGK